MPVDQGFRASLIRTLGFYRKELLSVLRQPRLVLTLIMGPFLILLLFGLGYRDTQPPFRTLLVLGNENAQLAADTEDLSEAFGKGITLEGTTTDLEEAKRELATGKVDLLIVAPEDPLQTLESGAKAEFEVIHGQIDPVVRSSIDLLAELSVDEINRRVLASVIDVAQTESEEVEDPVAALRLTASVLVTALEGGDRASADQQIEELRQELSDARIRTQGADSLFASVAAALGTSDEQLWADIEATMDQVNSVDSEEALSAARDLESSLSNVETQITRAQQLNPDLLVSPFGVEVVQVNDVTDEPGAFYSPGTLIVLVQHLAVTFAALSLVRERQLGLTDVFRASPLASGESLAGKYLGFATIGLTVAAALSGLMLVLGVDFRGSFIQYALVVILVILASLGLGFVLSGVSKTDTQAVQYSMMVLLVSIFFTGFVLPLSQLTGPVQVISYLIPATYGIRAVQDVIFRGSPVEPLMFGGLAVYTLALGTAAWFVVRRDVMLVRSR